MVMEAQPAVMCFDKNKKTTEMETENYCLILDERWKYAHPKIS